MKESSGNGTSDVLKAQLSKGIADVQQGVAAYKQGHEGFAEGMDLFHQAFAKVTDSVEFFIKGLPSLMRGRDAILAATEGTQRTEVQEAREGLDTAAGCLDIDGIDARTFNNRLADVKDGAFAETAGSISRELEAIQGAIAAFETYRDTAF